MDGVVTDFCHWYGRDPVGVVFDSSGNLYVANCNDNTIRKVDPNGTVKCVFKRNELFLSQWNYC